MAPLTLAPNSIRQSLSVASCSAQLLYLVSPPLRPIRFCQAWELPKYSNGAEQDPTERLCRIELAARVRRAISQLPDKQSRAIVMRYLEQQDYPAIAETLRCTHAGARSHVSKAIAALKDKLAALVPQE